MSVVVSVCGSYKERQNVAINVVEGNAGLEVWYFLTRFVRVHGNCFIGNFHYQNSEMMSKIIDFQIHNSYMMLIISNSQFHNSEMMSIISNFQFHNS